MRYLAGIVLIFCLLSGGAIFVSAQNGNLSPPPKRKFRHDSKVETSFDKSKNETFVYLRMMPVNDLFIKEPSFPHAPILLAGGMRLSVFYYYPGKTQATPQRVNLGFQLGYPDLQNLSDYTLVVKADDQLINLGAMNRLTSDPSKSAHEYVTVESALPYDTFLLIANAKKVEMQVGIINFELTENHLEAIRDLASRTGDSSSQTVKDDGASADQQKGVEKKTDEDEAGSGLRGKAISMPKPEYPPSARAARASGVVIVMVTVDESGNVIAARALAGHQFLRQTAEDAARRAKFAPTIYKGQPVKVMGVISYVFR